MSATETQSGRNVKMIDGVKHVEMKCVAGDHLWFRKSQRGKPPTNCPEHTTTVTPTPKAATPKATVDTSNLPAEVQASMAQAEALLAAKAKKDMEQVEDKKNQPKSTAQLEAEREAERQRIAKKAAAELASIDTQIEEAQKDADAKSEANLAAMDAVNEKKPETMRKQDATFKMALHACADVRKLRQRKAELEKVAA